MSLLFHFSLVFLGVVVVVHATTLASQQGGSLKSLKQVNKDTKDTLST